MRKKERAREDRKTTMMEELINARNVESPICHIQHYTPTLNKNTTKMATREEVAEDPKKTPAR